MKGKSFLDVIIGILILTILFMIIKSCMNRPHKKKVSDNLKSIEDKINEDTDKFREEITLKNLDKIYTAIFTYSEKPMGIFEMVRSVDGAKNAATTILKTIPYTLLRRDLNIKNSNEIYLANDKTWEGNLAGVNKNKGGWVYVTTGNSYGSVFINCSEPDSSGIPYSAYPCSIDKSMRIDRERDGMTKKNLKNIYAAIIANIERSMGIFQFPKSLEEVKMALTTTIEVIPYTLLRRDLNIKDSNEIYLANDKTWEGNLAGINKNKGGWVYVVTGPKRGEIFINCSEQDSFGIPYSAYPCW